MNIEKLSREDLEALSEDRSLDEIKAMTPEQAVRELVEWELGASVWAREVASIIIRCGADINKLAEGK